MNHNNTCPARLNTTSGRLCVYTILSDNFFLIALHVNVCRGVGCPLASVYTCVYFSKTHILLLILLMIRYPGRTLFVLLTSTIQHPTLHSSQYIYIASLDTWWEMGY